MRLYHGTSVEVGLKAFTDGLLPRSETKLRSGWKHAPSHTKCVYLTDTYGLYFAMCAAHKSGVGAVVEIDADMLDPWDLVPDEDALEQTTRGHDGIPGTMKERTAWYRKRLHHYRDGENWKTSLRAIGNCAHWGPIPAEAVTRVALIDASQARVVAMNALDAMIGVPAYNIAGFRHRLLQTWVFGDPLPELNEFQEFTAQGTLRVIEHLTRDGIRVLTHAPEPSDPAD